MPLYQITPAQLPLVWESVAPMLQRAIDLDPGDVTIEQVEYLIRIGKTFLLVWEEPGTGITGSAAVDLIDYPRQRVAHISLLGGKGIVQTPVFDEVKNWARASGATTVQCWANGALVELYKKVGAEPTHQVMRVKL